MNEVDENIFAEFVKMRKSIKKPLTEHAIKLARNKLARFQQDGHNVNEILNQSIFYNWQGLFEVKTNGQVNGSKSTGLGGNGGGNKSFHERDVEEASRSRQSARSFFRVHRGGIGLDNKSHQGQIDTGRENPAHSYPVDLSKMETIET